MASADVGRVLVAGLAAPGDDGGLPSVPGQDMLDVPSGTEDAHKRAQALVGDHAPTGRSAAHAPEHDAPGEPVDVAGVASQAPRARLDAGHAPALDIRGDATVQTVCRALAKAAAALERASAALGPRTAPTEGDGR